MAERENMEFAQIVKQRYATKSYDGKEVPEEKVKALQEIIRHAPSSYNIQPWRIIVITDKATKERLAPAAWNQPQITSCSHLFVFCADTDVAGKIDRLEEMTGSADFGKMLRDFNSAMDDRKRLCWAQRQTYLALGNAVNGAKSLGFDSSPMEGFDPVKFAEILKLPENLVPTTLCAIGFANDTPRPKMRFSHDEVFTEMKV